MSEELKDAVVADTATKPEAPTPSTNKSAEDELKELKAQLQKANALISKANSEAASWKKQYTATLDEQKQKEMDAAEKRKAELEELETLRSERRIDHYTKKFMESGYDVKTADAMARKLPPGVDDEFFATNKTFMESQRQTYLTDALKSQPGLSVGMPPTVADAQRDEMNRLRKAFGLSPI